MKEYSKYVLTKYGYYTRKACDSFELEILGDLLNSDVGSDFEDFIKWANDSSYKRFSGNLLLCHKEDDSIKLYFDHELMEDSDPLTVSRKTFISIMENWGRLYKEKPKEIIITRDGDVVTLEGKN